MRSDDAIALPSMFKGDLPVMTRHKPERILFLPALFSIAVANSSAAHAETVYLACKDSTFGSSAGLSVTIDLGARRVVILGDYGLRWQANARIFENRIYWETYPSRGTDTWTLDRYTLTLRTTSYDRINTFFYSCKISARPPHKKI
jgi:hypothetical protein